MGAELGLREGRGCHRMGRVGLGMCCVAGDLSDFCPLSHRSGLGHVEWGKQEMLRIQILIAEGEGRSEVSRVGDFGRGWAG